MVPYDVPHVAHDMILRFMGMNFSAITDGSARIPSKVGNEEKPIPTTIDGDKDASLNPIPVGKTPEQDKAMWEGTLTAYFLRMNLVTEISQFIQRTTTRGRLHSFLCSLPLQSVCFSSSGDANEDEGYLCFREKRTFPSTRRRQLSRSLL